ncbi:SH2B adapter protein 1-like [Rhincodon typus]|uniref:SH2B adapter protein 1-like n=1 Tax=Rhincodon typus TaxID=259920 RepID=UPI002030D5EE|nr:SH2B adapter protein 1-like [Rhincodon typus]
MNGGLPVADPLAPCPPDTALPSPSPPPPSGPAVPPAGWEEFCQRHARQAALAFACQLRAFLREGEAARRGPEVDGGERASAFGRLFARHFVRSFEEEVGARRRVSGTEGEEEEEGEEGRSESSLSSPASPPSPAPPSQARSTEELEKAPRLRKRFSLRSVGRTVRGSVRGILHWRGGGGGGGGGSEEGAGERRRASAGHAPSPSAPRSAERQERWTHRFERLRLARATPAPAEQRDVRREGLLQYVAADEAGTGRNRWAKCRVVLRRGAEGEGYRLEFYTPPKSKGRPCMAVRPPVEGQTLHGDSSPSRSVVPHTALLPPSRRRSPAW